MKPDKELINIAEILAQNAKDEKQAEKLKEIKKKAVAKQKTVLRKKIVEREVELLEDQITPDSPKVVQNIEIFRWKAPVRIMVSFDNKTFVISIAVILLFIVFLAILEKYMLMFAIVSLLFFIYVAGTTTPAIVTHKITTRGVDTLDHLYEWDSLEDFMFTKKNDQELLVINTKNALPANLIMLIDSADREAIFVLLQDKLLYRDIRKQGRFEKITFGEYIPLDKI